MVRLAQTVHLSDINTNTISKWTEQDSTWPTSSGVSKRISEPMVPLAQTVHLSYVNTNTISKQNERDSTWPTSSGESKTISEPMVRLAQTVHYLTSTLTPSSNRPNDIPCDPRHLGVPSGASKTISEPMVPLAQTVHLSYINTNTISKRTERDSIRPLWSRSCIGCIQHDIWAYGTFSANCAPMLRQH